MLRPHNQYLQAARYVSAHMVLLSLGGCEFPESSEARASLNAVPPDTQHLGDLAAIPRSPLQPPAVAVQLPVHFATAWHVGLDAEVIISGLDSAGASRTVVMELPRSSEEPFVPLVRELNLSGIQERVFPTWLRLVEGDSVLARVDGNDALWLVDRRSSAARSLRLPFDPVDMGAIGGIQPLHLNHTGDLTLRGPHLPLDGDPGPRWLATQVLRAPLRDLNGGTLDTVAVVDSVPDELVPVQQFGEQHGLEGRWLMIPNWDGVAALGAVATPSLIMLSKDLRYLGRAYTLDMEDWRCE